LLHTEPCVTLCVERWNMAANLAMDDALIVDAEEGVLSSTSSTG